MPIDKPDFQPPNPVQLAISEATQSEPEVIQFNNADGSLYYCVVTQKNIIADSRVIDTEIARLQAIKDDFDLKSANVQALIDAQNALKDQFADPTTTITLPPEE